MRRLVSILFALSTTACATVDHGPMQRIHVESEPAGAAVRLDACGLGSSKKATTPATVWVNRRATRCTIVLSAEGFRNETVLLRRAMTEAIDDNFDVVNGLCDDADDCNSLTDLFAVGAVTVVVSGTGVGIDAATGALWELQPSKVYASLRPASEESEDP